MIIISSDDGSSSSNNNNNARALISFSLSLYVRVCIIVIVFLGSICDSHVRFPSPKFTNSIKR